VILHPKVWFLRHGETFWNAEGRIQGRLESPLTARGEAQARAQARLMEPILAQKPDCFVSPLGRAQQTARIVLGDHPYRTESRLVEAHAGAWQGLLRADVRRDTPGLEGASSLELFLAAPGGEGYEALHARVADFLDCLSAPAIVIAHGLLGQVLRGLSCGLARAEMSALPNAQGCVYVLEQGRETCLAPDRGGRGLASPQALG